MHFLEHCIQTIDTINHLLRLSASLHLRDRIKDLAYGRLGTQTYSNDQLSNYEVGPISPTVSFANHDAQSPNEHDRPRGSSMYLSLRMPVGSFMPKRNNPTKNLLDPIHSEWRRIQSLSSEIRNNTPLVDVLVIGSGSTVVQAAIEFVYSALSHEKSLEISSSLSHNMEGKNNVESIIQIVKTPFKNKDAQSNAGSSSIKSGRKRKLKFLNSTDPMVFHSVTSYLNPSTTCVVTLDMCQPKEEECRAITVMVRNWLISNINNAETSDIVKKQMFHVTATPKKRPNSNTFTIPNHSSYESFTAFSAAGLLPLSILFGWDVTSELLSGAHSMDCHFVETTPRHNTPILLGLVDIWNDVFMGHHTGRTVTRFDGVLGSYPRYVSLLENKVLGGANVGDWRLKDGKCSKPTPVIDGANGYPGLYTEFVTAFDPIHNKDTIMADAFKSNDERMCFMLQQADTLAFGNREVPNNHNMGVSCPGSPPAIQSCDSILSAGSGVNGTVGNTADSNQPSTLILCGKCDAFSCGQLVAMAEHRALVKAWLWGIDPFYVSKKPAISKTEGLMEGLSQMYHDSSLQGTPEECDDDTKIDVCDVGMTGSTRNILNHYSARMQRVKNQLH